mmetsp:Transcript_37731/g.92743  ORF Transcript_37731/g.92743 Transcript_37731/m.92743 type:complete len:358 (+) Transcript_37731:426-1499(+)
MLRHVRPKHHLDQHQPQLHVLFVVEASENVDFVMVPHRLEDGCHMVVFLDALIVVRKGPLSQAVFVEDVAHPIVPRVVDHRRQKHGQHLNITKVRAQPPSAQHKVRRLQNVSGVGRVVVRVVEIGGRHVREPRLVDRFVDVELVDELPAVQDVPPEDLQLPPVGRLAQCEDVEVPLVHPVEDRHYVLYLVGRHLEGEALGAGDGGVVRLVAEPEGEDDALHVRLEALLVALAQRRVLLPQPLRHLLVHLPARQVREEVPRHHGAVLVELQHVAGVPTHVLLHRGQPLALGELGQEVRGVLGRGELGGKHVLDVRLSRPDPSRVDVVRDRGYAEPGEVPREVVRAGRGPRRERDDGGG